MFSRILIPTDGSDAVMPAVETALDVAKTYDATLHVLFLVESPSSVSGAGSMGLDDVLDELKQEGQQATNEIAALAAHSNVETETTVRQGDPREDILTYAIEHDIDLIAMGTHGRSGVKRTLLGSVTEGVVRHSEIPVLTVHREPDE